MGSWPRAPGLFRSPLLEQQGLHLSPRLSRRLPREQGADQSFRAQIYSHFLSTTSSVPRCHRPTSLFSDALSLPVPPASSWIQVQFGRAYTMEIVMGDVGPVFRVKDDANGEARPPSEERPLTSICLRNRRIPCVVLKASGHAERAQVFSGESPTKPWTDVCLAKKAGTRISGCVEERDGARRGRHTRACELPEAVSAAITFFLLRGWNRSREGSLSRAPPRHIHHRCPLSRHRLPGRSSSGSATQSRCGPSRHCTRSRNWKPAAAGRRWRPLRHRCMRNRRATNDKSDAFSV